MTTSQRESTDVVFLTRDDRFINVLFQVDRKKTTGTLTLTSTRTRSEAAIELIDGMIVAAKVPWACVDLSSALLPLFEGIYRVVFDRAVGCTSEGGIRGSVDPLEIAVQSLYKYTPSEVVDDMLETVGRDTSLRFVNSIETERLKLNAQAEGLLLWLAHRPTSLSRLQRQITCHPEMARRFVYFLLSMGALVPEPKKPMVDDDDESSSSEAALSAEPCADPTIQAAGAQHMVLLAV